ncbi:hypothetical protein C1889_14745 [Pseudomonas sp. FW507-12TSA]|nr:hypothetical protein C1889_14745 [Pseudomonas sp. FW507-12TSA]
MTTTSYLETPVSMPLNIDSKADAFEFRPGTLEDIDGLAELFQSIYGHTTHPCQSPVYIRNAMNSDQQRWFVVENQCALLGCVCITRRPWNQSWEVGHGVIHPDARRGGAISNLIRLCLEDHRPDAMELGYYTPRNIAIHSVMGKIKPAVLVGHDGGPNKVDGIREYHLTAIHPPAQDGFVHIAPWYAKSSGSDFISQYLYASLQMEPVLGAYPNTYLSGAPGTERHGQMLYTQDHEANALMVSGHSGNYPSEREVLQELEALVQAHKDIEYVSVHVLADKLELLGGLMRQGYAVTAYLPAWHLQGGARYDCINLVWHKFDQAPRSHGFDEEVVFFDQAYARLGDNLCSIRPGHAPRIDN